MSMVYGGQIQTMMHKLHSRNYAGMELIRPLYMVKEADIIRWVEQNDLHFIRCACRFTESYEGLEKKGEVSKRQEMKELIAKFRATNPNIENNIFKSVYNVNLRFVLYAMSKTFVSNIFMGIPISAALSIILCLFASL